MKRGGNFSLHAVLILPDRLTLAVIPHYILTLVTTKEVPLMDSTILKVTFIALSLVDSSD